MGSVLSIRWPSRGVKVIVAIAAAALCSFTLHAQESAPGKKVEIPNETARTEALAIVREVYEADFKKARTLEAKSQFAKRLIQEGIKNRSHPPSSYVLLRVAKDTAITARDAEAAILAIDALAAQFAVDGLDLKATSLTKISNSVRAPADHKKLIEHFSSVIGDLIAAERFQLAESLATTAGDSARKARDAVGEATFAATVREIKLARQAADEVKKHLATLEVTPTDPVANHAVGIYHCLIKGDWGAGLPMMALSDQPVTKEQALLDLQQPDDMETQILLADRWFKMAENYKGRQRDHVLGRAALWYQQAVNKSKGLSRLRIEKQLKKIGDVPIPRLAARRDVAVVPKPENPVKVPDPLPAKTDKPLLVHLPLSKDLRDISGKNRHGAKIGEISFHRDGYAQFGGSRDYIRLPHMPLNGRSFAISFWVRLDKENEGNSFLEQIAGRQRNMMLHIETRNARRPRMGFFANDIDSSTSMAKAGTWQHLVFQYGSGQQQIWLDGKRIAARSSIPYSGAAGNMYLGKSPKWTGMPHSDLDGGMLDFRIYGAELTPDEIAALHKSRAKQLSGQ
jgi:hypothetical protein